MPRRFTVLLLLAAACAQPQPRPNATPHRIVTLAPNLTEIVYALGEGKSLVATDDYSDFPPAAKQLPKVGGVQPNVERIAALKPDLAFATTIGSSPALAKALGAVGIPLVQLRHERVADIRVAIERIGSALGSPNVARVVGDLQRGLAAQRRTRARKPRVLVAVWTDPIFVGGRDTFANDLLELTGAENAVPPQVTGWPQYSLEAFVARPPDLLIYPDRAVSRAQIDALLARANVKCEAVPIDENRFTRLGPRTPEAAAQLNALFDRWEAAHR